MTTSEVVVEGSYVKKKNSVNTQHWNVSRSYPVKIILVQLEYFSVFLPQVDFYINRYKKFLLWLCVCECHFVVIRLFAGPREGTCIKGTTS